MYCTSCGTPAPADATFCTGCGAGLYGASDSGQGTTPTTIGQAELVAAAHRVQQIITEYPALTLPVPLLRTLAADPTDASALAQARQILGPNYLADLIALKSVPQSDLQYLEKWGPIVAQAARDGQLSGR